MLDTGHAHVNGWDIPAVVKALGERLVACHVHDNDGNGDAHLPVGQGDIDWKAYFGAVKNMHRRLRRYLNTAAALIIPRIWKRILQS